MSPAFLDPPIRWRVGDGYFSTSKFTYIVLKIFIFVKDFVAFS